MDEAECAGDDADGGAEELRGDGHAKAPGRGFACDAPVAWAGHAGDGGAEKTQVGEDAAEQKEEAEEFLGHVVGRRVGPAEKEGSARRNAAAFRCGKADQFT